MPTVLRVGGHRFYFYSEENNEPPHVHIRSAENRAKFWLDPVTLVNSRGYNPGEIREVQRITEENQAILLEKWYEHFQG